MNDIRSKDKALNGIFHNMGDTDGAEYRNALFDVPWDSESVASIIWRLMNMVEDSDVWVMLFKLMAQQDSVAFMTDALTAVCDDEPQYRELIDKATRVLAMHNEQWREFSMDYSSCRDTRHIECAPELLRHQLSSFMLAKVNVRLLSYKNESLFLGKIKWISESGFGVNDGAKELDLNIDEVSHMSLHNDGYVEIFTYISVQASNERISRA